MKGKYVNICKNCGVAYYGYNAPVFCSYGCEYRYNKKLEAVKK